VESARAIGEQYLKSDSHNHEIGVFLRYTGLSHINPIQETDYDNVKLQFQTQRSQDFAMGNTVILDGYVLARSEVGLCAILSLLDNKIVSINDY